MNRFVLTVLILLYCVRCFPQQRQDTLAVFKSNDSLSVPLLDITDSSRIAKSDVDAPIRYTAKDSLIYDLKNKKVFLYNEAQLIYKDLKLDAGRINVNEESQTL